MGQGTREISVATGARKNAVRSRGSHVQLQWGLICNQSRSLYGRESTNDSRSREEQVMYKAICRSYLDRPIPWGFRPRNARMAPAVGAALGKGSEEGGGLHNIAASLQMPSPEFENLPTSALGVPVFAKMTTEQKRTFLRLCGVDVP